MSRIFTSNGTHEIDVLFCIEHYDREIEVALELARMLCKQGVSVGFASTIYHVYSIVNVIKASVVVTASTAFGEGSVGAVLSERYGDQIKFINLNYEQFISSWKGKYKTSNSKISKDKQLQLVWGEYYKNILIDDGFNEDNIIITGRPHIDYLKAKRNAINLKRTALLSEKGVNANKKLVFVALTDGLAFVGEDKIQYIVSQGAIEIRLRDSIRSIRSNLRELFKQIVCFKSDEYHFVLRPHPSVPEARYKDIINEFSNSMEWPSHVSILKDYDAYTWLMVCDVFLTNYSTLCIEAGVLNVPTFAFQNEGEELGRGVWYMENIQKISKLDGIVKPPHSLFKENNFYMDFRLNGLEMTVQAILGQVPESYLRLKAKTLPIFFRKRLVGSIIRNCALNSKALLRFMPRTRGLVHDYFTQSDIEKKLKGL